MTFASLDKWWMLRKDLVYGAKMRNYNIKGLFMNDIQTESIMSSDSSCLIETNMCLALKT